MRSRISDFWPKGPHRREQSNCSVPEERVGIGWHHSTYRTRAFKKREPKNDAELKLDYLVGIGHSSFLWKKIRDDDYGKSFRIILPAFSVIRRVVLPKVLCQDSRHALVPCRVAF